MHDLMINIVAFFIAVAIAIGVIVGGAFGMGWIIHFGGKSLREQEAHEGEAGSGKGPDQGSPQ